MKPVEIILTTTKRPNFLVQTLKSLQTNTNKDLYNLTIINDGCKLTNAVIQPFLNQENFIDDYIYSKENMGLAPSFSKAWGVIKERLDYTGDWKENPFICYIQDDLEFKKNWLTICINNYKYFKSEFNLGFVTGHNAPEHKIISHFIPGPEGEILFKPWIRATHMMAPFDYWDDMIPISHIDPETNQERAKPNNGVGSGFDWWFLRNSENSVCKTGKVNLVIPGLVKHIGNKNSTWFKGVLPENE